MRPTIPVLVDWNPGAMIGEAAKLTGAADQVTVVKPESDSRGGD